MAPCGPPARRPPPERAGWWPAPSRHARRRRALRTRSKRRQSRARSCRAPATSTSPRSRKRGGQRRTDDRAPRSALVRLLQESARGDPPKRGRSTRHRPSTCWRRIGPPRAPGATFRCRRVLSGSRRHWRRSARAALQARRSCRSGPTSRQEGCPVGFARWPAPALAARPNRPHRRSRQTDSRVREWSRWRPDPAASARR